MGRNPAWLEKQLNNQGISSASEVFLGLYGAENQLICYKMSDDPAIA